MILQNIFLKQRSSWQSLKVLSVNEPPGIDDNRMQYILTKGINLKKNRAATKLFMRWQIRICTMIWKNRSAFLWISKCCSEIWAISKQNKSWIKLICPKYITYRIITMVFPVKKFIVIHKWKRDSPKDLVDLNFGQSPAHRRCFPGRKQVYCFKVWLT